MLLAPPPAGLQTLDLKGCQLSGTLSGEWDLGSSLVALNLGRNSLSGPLPAVWRMPPTMLNLLLDSEPGGPLGAPPPNPLSFGGPSHNRSSIVITM